MATPQLKRHQAVIWLPPRSAGESVLSGDRAVLYAHLGNDPDVALRRVSLDALEGIRQVWLIADARDVMLITASVPPLSGKRLRQALPNVVEEYLLQDPARCLIAPGPVLSDGQRVIGVIDDAWVDSVLAAFKQRGIGVEALWPAQLVLPWSAGQWSMMVADDHLTVRTGEWAGSGWAAGENEESHRETAQSLLTGKLLGQPPDRVQVWLADGSWRSTLKTVLGSSETMLHFEPVPLVRSASLDLLSAKNGGIKDQLGRIDWRLWRGVGALLIAVLLASLLGLNLHWLQLRSEANDLQAAVRERFKDTFPNAVMVDPVLQMRRSVAELRLKSGRPGPEDFVPMLARFSQAVGSRGQGTVEAIEYRENAMKIRFSPEAVNNPQAREALVQDAVRLGLTLAFDNQRDPTARLVPQGR
ncbi:MAG: type II secretion system protein GspL [Lautropia sp.]|nr:type II secretion system protein GspL [Lautropia sp.]